MVSLLFLLGLSAPAVGQPLFGAGFLGAYSTYDCIAIVPSRDLAPHKSFDRI